MSFWRRCLCRCGMRSYAQAMLCKNFGPFGPLFFPYRTMGNVDSFHLFGAQELELFAFYDYNRGRYKQVRDIGANLGLHSLLMAKCGWVVIAYEPEPGHYAAMRNVFDVNGVEVGSSCVAVSDRTGEAEFVRVLDNTTASHLEGMKIAYGPLDRFQVTTVDARDVFRGADFVKIDAEGSEAVILETQGQDCPDVMTEIGSTENARRIYEHCCRHGMRMWAQRIDWCEVGNVLDLPVKPTEGNLFIGKESPFG